MRAARDLQRKVHGHRLRRRAGEIGRPVGRSAGLRRSRVALAAALFVAALALALPAVAHQVGISRGTYTARDGKVLAHVALSRLEIVTSVDGIDANQDGRLSADELASKRSAVEAIFVGKTHVTANGTACPGKLESLGLEEPDGVGIDMTFTCDGSGSTVAVDLGFLDALDPAHRHLYRGEGGTAPFDDIAYRGPSRFELTFARSAEGARTNPFVAGVRAASTSIDSIAFLVGLLLVANAARRRVLSPIAFFAGLTIAATLTQSAILAPPPQVVGIATALSVVYVGLDELATRAHVRLASLWPAALSMGALHGFALGSLTPSGSLASPLLAFDTGAGLVLGGIAIGVGFALARSRGRRWFDRRLRPALAAALALAGAARVALAIVRAT